MQRKKIIVLGAGLVGKPMALDLLNEPDVEIFIADKSEERLHAIQMEYGIQTISVDISDTNHLKDLLIDFDLVVNAVPGFMGFQTLKTILESGKQVVDIAFSPENLSELNDLAIEKGATALVDFGVAPGLSHLVVGYCAHLMDKLNKVRIYVGGLPKIRRKPFEYTAVFSPIDVIEEYTRPARLIQNGKIVEKEALSDVEQLDFDRAGTLEAFNSDGLRSLVYSIQAEDMAEKTLRYPGHADLMRILRETGFFSQEPVDLGNQKVKPMDLTGALLFPQWQMKEDDVDITVMKIVCEGLIEGQNHRYTFDLYDELDQKSGIHSMARTTGYTATMGVRLLLNEQVKEPGVFYPEKLGSDKKVLDFILKGLRARGIQLDQQLEKV